jgi:hypothetical protein
MEKLAAKASLKKSESIYGFKKKKKASFNQLKQLCCIFCHFGAFFRKMKKSFIWRTRPSVLLSEYHKIETANLHVNFFYKIQYKNFP